VGVLYYISKKYFILVRSHFGIMTRNGPVR